VSEGYPRAGFDVVAADGVEDQGHQEVRAVASNLRAPIFVPIHRFGGALESVVYLDAVVGFWDDHGEVRFLAEALVEVIHELAGFGSIQDLVVRECQVREFVEGRDGFASDGDE
jgi:hypothetical protein